MPENKKKRTYEEVQAEINFLTNKKKEYQKKVSEAISKVESDPDKVSKLRNYVNNLTLGANEKERRFCIGSACYTLNQAGELLKYTSNALIEKDITNNKLKGYRYDYNLNDIEVGDILQLNNKTEKGLRGAPYHGMLVKKVEKDKSGNVTAIEYYGSQGLAESFGSHRIEGVALDNYKADKTSHEIIKKDFIPNSLYAERDMVKPFVKPRVEKYKDYVPNEQIKYLGSNDESEDKKQNREKYINKMMGRKEELMKAYNLSNNEYNDLVKLSAGILDQESEYGTSTRYKLKNIPGVQFAGKWIKGETLEALDLDEYSVGPGQSKPKYFPSKAGEKFGITPESEEATLITVLDRYSNQVPSNLKGTPAGYLKTANVYKGMSSDYNEYAQSVLDKAASFGFPNYNESKTSFIDIKNKEREKKQEVMKQSFAPVVNQENFVNVKKEPTVKFKNGGVLIVNNKNAPELKAYNDSLNLFNRGEEKLKYWRNNSSATNSELNLMEDRIDRNFPVSSSSSGFGSNMINSIGMKPIGSGLSLRNIPLYKKPVQPVIFQKLEPIKPLGIKPMETSVEAKLAGNVTVPAMSNTKGVTQNYTGSKALQIQGKPSGYTNEGDRTGRQEFRKGGWLDGLDNNNPIQDNTRVKTTVIPNQALISKSNLNKNKGTLKSIDRMPEQPLTREEVRKGIKFTTDVAGLFYPPAAIAGAAMDMHQGDKTGALIGLIPGAKDFLTNKNMVTKLATKAFNLGIPNKVIQPSKKVIREAGKYIKGSAEVVEAKDDIGTPIVETVKSKLKNGGWLDGLEEGKTEQAPDVTNATEYIKNWYNSPMYGNILRNQIADAGIKSPKRTERIVKRFSKNFNQDLNNSFYDITPNLVDDPTHYGRGILDYKGGRKIELNKNFVETSPKLVNSLFAHELAHDNLMTDMDKRYINQKTMYSGTTPGPDPGDISKDWYNIITDPGEVRSQIHSIRQLSKENQIYDPFTEPFKKEYLDKVNESYKQGTGTEKHENYNQLKRLRQIYSDNQITEMMNTISKSNSNDGKVYAKNGGWLNNLPNNKFDMGGVLDGLDGVDKGTQVPDATATAKPVVNLNFAITPAQKQLAAKNKRQRELDDNPASYNVMKDYVGMGIKEPGLQTPAVDPIDLVGTGAYKGLAKALGAKEVAVAADAALFNSLDKSKVLYNQVKTKAKDEIYKLKYKKDIASLESKKFNAMQKMNNPEGWKRLREQGIEPKQFFDQLNKSKITSTRDIGSFDNGAQINIDFNQVKKLQKEGYDLSVDNIIDHEIGHRMQRGFNSKAVNDYNQAKSYNRRNQVPEYHVYSTPLDKEAELLLSPVIKNPNRNSNYFLFGSDNKERLPFLREAKESMVSKGFINNIYSKITPETVKKFLKEVPSNRFSTFLDVENPITHRRLSGLLNKTPIVAGAGLGVNELAKDKKQNGGWLDNLK